ncbi:MAG: DUF58 domain-containing protein [Nocardioides sp.]
MQRVRSLLGIVNPLGWVVLGLGAVAAAVAFVTQWREVAVLAAACALLLLVAVPFLFGRTRVRVTLTLEPERVVAGDSVAAGVDVTNTAGHRLLPTVLELPVGQAMHRYGIPMLAPDATHEESFTVRTERRGVIAVGPATTRRGDPLAIFSRDVSWTEVTEILVRPPMVPLDSLGAGLLRDLEGVATDAVSHSDLAFHALREYVPGDDLRHIHWRSSAKAMASAGENQLLVRQYLDTRRSHATIVVDDAAPSWADGDDFETAMSLAASIAVRAMLDDFEASYVCGAHASSGSDGHRALDAICRSELSPAGDRTGLIPAARRAAAVAPDTSLLFLISGAGTGFETCQRAAASFPPEVRRLAVLIDPTATSRVVEASGLPVLTVAAKEDLAGLLRWSVK